MIRIKFTQADIEQLFYERYHHPHPQVRKKMEVLYLKSKGLPHQEIRRLCDISKTTLTVYLRQYQAAGIEGLKELHYKGQPSELNPYADMLKDHFKLHPPRTSGEAQAEIERLTGVKRSQTQVRAFLKRIGLRSRKDGYVPGKSEETEKVSV